jgi:hypothetical protein
MAAEKNTLQKSMRSCLTWPKRAAGSISSTA